MILEGRQNNQPNFHEPNQIPQALQNQINISQIQNQLKIK